jgi:hypothetical protein
MIGLIVGRLSEPSAPQPGLLAGDAVADVWDRVNIYDGGETFLRDLAAIPEAKRHLVVAFWCDREVINGGFQQLFWNSTGVLVPEAAAAYRALGLDLAAALFEAALHHFPHPYPRDCMTRRRTFTQLPGKDYPPPGQFDRLDKAYYDLFPGPEFGRAADAYALHNVT